MAPTFKSCVSRNIHSSLSYLTTPYWLGIMVLSLGVGLTVKTDAQAATLTVTTAEDLVDATDGELSFREAIAEAQAGDTITFDPSLSGQPIKVVSRFDQDFNRILLVIDKDLIVEGLGASQLSIQIHDDEPDGALTIAKKTHVTISGVTINCRARRFGRCRGIRNLGTLTLLDSVVDGKQTNPEAGFREGIINSGDMTLINTIVRDNVVGGDFGGTPGIQNTGTMRLIKSTVTNNRTRFGAAGIFNRGIMTLTNSTVNGNESIFRFPTCTLGGGITNFGEMLLTNTTVSENRGIGNAGIENTGMLTLINSTVSGNQTQGTSSCGGSGVYNSSSGKMNLINSTISDNVITDVSVINLGEVRGGGIFNDGGTVTLFHTIIAGNEATNSPDCVGTLTSSGYNLVGAGTGCPSDGLGDLTVLPDAVFTDVLGPLQNNGGPTNTHALLNQADNRAIDGGNPAGCVDQEGEALTTDQRGFPRPSERGGMAICDIGAVELQLLIPGDLDKNGCVDQADLRLILTAIRGTAPQELSHDLNGDGDVNIADARKLVTLFTNSRGTPCS